MMSLPILTNILQQPSNLLVIVHPNLSRGIFPVQILIFLKEVLPLRPTIAQVLLP